jgi:hypothetical protein
MKKTLVVACCVIVICSFFTSSLLLILLAPFEGNLQTSLQPTPQTPAQKTPQPTPINIAQSTDPVIQRAIKNAITYLKQTQNPTGLLMLNVIFRQFGIAEFNNSLQSYDQLMTSNPDPLLRIFRRIADYTNSVVKPEDFNSVTDQLDRLTVPALYSDRRDLPDDYLTRLTEAMDTGILYSGHSLNSGSYLLTHALLATIWLQNNRCSIQLPKDFTSTLYQENAALIGDGSQVDDIGLEAAAFLYQAGQGNLVNPVFKQIFVQNIIAAQFTDGGWSASQDTPANTSWHPSVLALMILLFAENPAQSYPPMIAPAPS